MTWNAQGGVDDRKVARYYSGQEKRRNSVAENALKQSPNQAIERKIESLTEELSGLINEAGTDGKEEMRDYAVSLLQGGTETTVLETTWV